MSIDSLPEDLLVEILKWLSPNQLLRIETVNRAWRRSIRHLIKTSVELVCFDNKNFDFLCDHYDCSRKRWLVLKEFIDNDPNKTSIFSQTIDPDEEGINSRDQSDATNSTNSHDDLGSLVFNNFPYPQMKNWFDPVHHLPSLNLESCNLNQCTNRAPEASRNQESNRSSPRLSSSAASSPSTSPPPQPSSPFFRLLAKCPRVRCVDLENVVITGQVLIKCLEMCPQLECVYISEIECTDQDWDRFVELARTKLRHINVETRSSDGFHVTGQMIQRLFAAADQLRLVNLIALDEDPDCILALNSVKPDVEKIRLKLWYDIDPTPEVARLITERVDVFSVYDRRSLARFDGRFPRLSHLEVVHGMFISHQDNGQNNNNNNNNNNQDDEVVESRIDFPNLTRLQLIVFDELDFESVASGYRMPRLENLHIDNINYIDELVLVQLFTAVSSIKKVKVGEFGDVMPIRFLPRLARLESGEFLIKIKQRQQFDVLVNIFDAVEQLPMVRAVRVEAYFKMHPTPAEKQLLVDRVASFAVQRQAVGVVVDVEVDRKLTGREMAREVDEWRRAMDKRDIDRNTRIFVKTRNEFR